LNFLDGLVWVLIGLVVVALALCLYDDHDAGPE
jgi:uncharacterized membrane protein